MPPIENRDSSLTETPLPQPLNPPQNYLLNIPPEITSTITSFLLDKDRFSFLSTSYSLKKESFYFLEQEKQTHFFNKLNQFLTENLINKKTSEPDEKLKDEITALFKIQIKEKTKNLSVQQELELYDSSLGLKGWEKIKELLLKDKIFAFTSTQQIHTHIHEKFSIDNIEKTIKKIIENFNEEELECFSEKLSNISESSRIKKIFNSIRISKNESNIIKLPLTEEDLENCIHVIELGYPDDLFRSEAMVINVLNTCLLKKYEAWFSYFLDKNITLNKNWGFLSNEYMTPKLLLHMARHSNALPASREKLSFLYQALLPLLSLPEKEKAYYMDAFFNFLSKESQFKLLKEMVSEGIFRHLNTENIFQILKNFPQERILFLKKTMQSLSSFWEEALQEEAQKKEAIEENFNSSFIGTRVEELLAKVAESDLKESNEFFMDLLDLFLSRKNIDSFQKASVIIRSCSSNPKRDQLLEDVLNHLFDQGHFKEAIKLVTSDLFETHMDQGKELQKKLVEKLELRVQQQLKEDPEMNQKKHQKLLSLHEELRKKKNS